MECAPVDNSSSYVDNLNGSIENIFLSVGLALFWTPKMSENRNCVQNEHSNLENKFKSIMDKCKLSSPGQRQTKGMECGSSLTAGLWQIPNHQWNR